MPKRTNVVKIFWWHEIFTDFSEVICFLLKFDKNYFFTWSFWENECQTGANVRGISKKLAVITKNLVLFCENKKKESKKFCKKENVWMIFTKIFKMLPDPAAWIPAWFLSDPCLIHAWSLTKFLLDSCLIPVFLPNLWPDPCLISVWSQFFN